MIETYGWPIFPCNRDRTPLTENGFYAATDSTKQHEAWAQKWPYCLWGMPMGRESGKMALDLDCKNGKDGVARLAELGFEIPETWTVETQSGGLHYYFKYPADVYKVLSTSDKIAPGVDTRGDGGYVVIPGSVGYDWVISPDDCEIAEMPQWLYDAVVLKEKPTVKPFTPSTNDHQRAVEALDYIDPDCSYEDWVAVGMALHTIGALDLWDEWSAKGSKWIPGECEKKWSSFKGNGVSLGSLIHMAREGGMPERSESNVYQFPPVDVYADEIGRDGGGYQGDNTARKQKPQQDAKTKPGKIEERQEWIERNVKLIYDDFAQQPYIKFNGEWARLEDHHITAIRTQASAQKLEIGKELAQDLVVATARANARHRVREYLEELEWDGVPRIESWIGDYLADTSAGAPLAIWNTYGKLWLIAAVARIMEPGCKVDSMIVIYGEQNAGKSRTARALAGKWFSDQMPVIGQHGYKDAQEHLQGRWIIEMAEMRSFSKHAEDASKSFLTSQEDIFRPSYGRNTVIRPRQCVFIGSTNNPRFLTDETGSRRFWAIKARRNIDVEGIEKVRDQLFAEALSEYRNDVVWWLDDAGEAMRAEANKWFSEVDPWTDILEEKLAGKNAVHRSDVIEWIFGRVSEFGGKIPAQVGRIRLSDGRRLDGVMTTLGFEPARSVRISGKISTGYHRKMPG